MRGDIDAAERAEAAGKLSAVIDVFHSVFAAEGVRLAGGFPEPFYRAPGSEGRAEIRFTRDYLNSSLHEVAHWCIAGRERRALDDYGYWYRPDGRNGPEQAEFFRAEAAPQSLEWAFAMACGADFRMSCDNLAGDVRGHADFAAALRGKLEGYLVEGFPGRAGRFLEGLMDRFHPEVGAGERQAWLRIRVLATNLSAG
ncbi:MAG: diaminobutyrate--2-oxoglutarate aminotransferase [Fibrobacteres bacterium]|nr:diaminobutyrate--2-oxoglutarate aminotransferase [Fibrobacterota bacterium]